MEEIRQLTALKHEHAELDLKYHMDGARFANAMVTLGDVAPKELTWAAGIDVLTFGGTKNGCPGTEALIFFDKTLAQDFAWRRKQTGQLASKMRFLSAPWIGMLKNDIWLKNARHANDHARRLGKDLAAMAGISLAFEVETNAVFAQLPDGLAEALHTRGWHFYRFENARAWRFMCTWSTTEEAIQTLLDDISELLKG
jgi:threonine aldolase